MLKKEHGFFMLRSEDQGKTWSEKYPIPVNNVHGATVLHDGSLFYCGRARSGNCLLTAAFADIIVAMRSTDDGVTWQEISQVAEKPGEHLAPIEDELSSVQGVSPLMTVTMPILSLWDELHSMQACDGTIITQIRYADGTWQMDSSDGGKTWRNLRRACGGYPSHLLWLADGRLLISDGYRRENYGNRCRISSDNGRSWSEPMILSEGAPSPDLGYASTAELSDGTLVTVWYEFRPDMGVAQLRCARWKLK